MPVINGVSLPFIPTGGIAELNKNLPTHKIAEPKTSFKDIFDEELNKVKFSAHAQSRLVSREIEFSAEEMQRLQNALRLASDKGSVESLVMLNNNAMIVSVPNKTVITVMNKEQLSNNVITNIDSAIFA